MKVKKAVFKVMVVSAVVVIVKATKLKFQDMHYFKIMKLTAILILVAVKATAKVEAVAVKAMKLKFQEMH